MTEKIDRDLPLKKKIANNILRLIKEKKWSQKKLAEQSGISTSTLSDYVNSRTLINPGNVEKIATALQVEKSDIDPTFKSDLILPHSSNEVNLQNNRTIDLYGSVAAGALAIVDGVTELNVEELTISPQILGPYANCKGLFAIRVNGDSMNKVIRDGEIVIAKQQEQYKDDDIVIFSHNGEYSLKRYKPNEITDYVLFKSESYNDQFQNIIIPKDTNGELKILGKVIYCGMIF